MSKSRVVGTTAIVCGVIVVIVLGGRREASHEINAERQGMARIFAAAGRVGVPDASRNDLTDGFRCLLYGKGVNAFAYELCFDQHGRLIESADRTTSTPVFFTLRSEPAKSAVVVSSSGLNTVLREMGAFAPTATPDSAVRWSPPPKQPNKRITVPRGSGLPGAA